MTDALYSLCMYTEVLLTFILQTGLSVAAIEKKKKEKKCTLFIAIRFSFAGIDFSSFVPDRHTHYVSGFDFVTSSPDLLYSGSTLANDVYNRSWSLEASIWPFYISSTRRRFRM